MAFASASTNAGDWAKIIMALRAKLLADLRPASDNILGRMHTEIDRLYGPRLGALWDVMAPPPDPGELARVHVGTIDPRVIGYEFGTKRHFIRISQDGRPVLHFNWHAGESWFAWVDHPGTKPHNYRDQIEAALAASALAEWGAVLLAMMKMTFA